MLIRWTGEVRWFTAREPMPRGWYPAIRTEETHYAPAGAYCRKRRCWWPLVVFGRVILHAWRA